MSSLVFVGGLIVFMCFGCCLQYVRKVSVNAGYAWNLMKNWPSVGKGFGDGVFRGEILSSGHTR